MSRIDLNQVWDDARAMGNANKDLLAAIAGMFVLLPGVISALLMSTPPEAPPNATSAQAFEIMLQGYADNWPVLLGHGLVTSFAALAMLVLLLRPERLTVGESLKTALILLPGYFIAYLIEALVGGAGLMLFVLPGLYIMARLALMPAVAAAEQCTNPIELIRRSIALTQGNGWRIFFLFAVINITGGIIALVLTVLTQIVGALLLPDDISDLLVSIVSGVVASALAAFIALVSAALYRATAGDRGVASIFD